MFMHAQLDMDMDMPIADADDRKVSFTCRTPR